MFERFFPSRKLVSDTDPKRPNPCRSFLADFEIRRADDRLEAITKKQYPHLCPDGVTRRFRYAVIGRNWDATCASVEDDEGVDVDADSLEVFLVPDRGDIPFEHVLAVHEEYFTYQPFDEFRKEVDEFLMLEFSYDFQAPSLIYVEYPAIGVDNPAGCFALPRYGGGTAYWPLPILNNIAGCIPFLEAHFNEVMSQSERPIGMTHWHELQVCLEGKTVGDYVEGRLTWATPQATLPQLPSDVVDLIAAFAATEEPCSSPFHIGRAGWTFRATRITNPTGRAILVSEDLSGDWTRSAVIPEEHWKDKEIILDVIEWLTR